MADRFTGQTAIITGASRGIGLAIAERLVAEGAKVVLTGRDKDALAEAVATLGGPDHALGVAGHAADTGHQDEAIAKAIDTFGSADLLVNNTAVNPVYGPLLALDPDVARNIVEVNCLAALSWTKKITKAWMGRHGGAIVNVASVGGIRPAPGIAMYGASKAMLMHLTKELAVELSPGIRVNAVAPAVVKTKFAAALYEGREDEVAAEYPLGRLGAPDDVGGVVAFLLSADAAWMTGRTLVVDGGLAVAGGA
ncbi:SDR family oxidoreductase [Streptomyces sp. NPDC056527]|uniref:SDR family oxidoreductase n=1 Tax=Streptomyces sp. NPDC056527 TaxID=3345853 RepID=UPI0036932615